VSLMKSLGIIPARYDSTRFPGKALVVIDGKSMIRRVYEQASRCPGLNRVVVATDHEGILNHVRDFGGEAVMTAASHQSGTDRCAEALKILSASEQLEADIVVNIQGDEPFIFPEQISEVLSCFTDPGVSIATLARKIVSPHDITDPNVVKLVFDQDHRVLYFSRSAIPYVKNGKANETHASTGDRASAGVPGAIFYEHVGIYGFRQAVLPQLVQLPESSLERTESLEQLRWLQHGFRIFVRETEYKSISIDTPSDLLKIPDIMH